MAEIEEELKRLLMSVKESEKTVLTLYIYYYYISSTSDQQALAPGGW